MKDDDIQTLIQYHMEEAQAALQDAKYLQEGDRSPRSIVNRLYYAMFYSALALLQKIEKAPSRHTGVLGLFDTEFVLKGIFPKEMSKHFHRAFELRQTTDYRITKPISKETVDVLNAQATDFVRKVSEYLES